MKAVLPWLLGLLLILVPWAEGVNYAISFPNPLRTSSTPRLFYFLSELNGSDNPLSLSCRLTDLSGNSITAAQASVSSDSNAQASGNIPLEISSSLIPGQYNLIFELLSGSSTVLLKNQTEVEVVIGGGMVMVETDRPIYKPGQTVKVRVLNFDQDLKPKTSSITIEIMDPKGFKVGKFELETDEYGYAETEFPISDEPNLGDWVVSASSETGGAQRSFKADKYVLPKFDVVLSFEKAYVTSGMDSLEGRLTATYSYGKPVHGTANVTLFRTGSMPYPDLPTAVFQDPPPQGDAGAPGEEEAPSDPNPATEAVPPEDPIEVVEPAPGTNPIPDIELAPPSPTSGKKRRIRGAGGPLPGEFPINLDTSSLPEAAAPPPEAEKPKASTSDQLPIAAGADMAPVADEPPVTSFPPGYSGSEVVESKLINLVGTSSFTFDNLADKISAGGQFYVLASVFEDETEISESSWVDLPYLYTENRYEISDVLFKPGLPLSFTFETFSGDKPADLTVQIVFVFSIGTDGLNSQQIPQTIQTVNGIQQVEIDVPSGTTSICLNIEGTQCAKSITMANSPSGSFISVSAPSNPTGSFAAGEVITFRISSTSSFAPSVDFPIIYHVISPRGMVQSGILKEGTDLAIQATAAMAPSARLVILTLRDGEVLADFANFQVSTLLENDVTATYDATETRPAAEVGIDITSQPLSRVGLVAIDKSVTILAGSSQFEAASVKDYLTGRDPLSQVSQASYWGSSKAGAGDLFRASGLGVLSNFEAAMRDEMVDFPIPQEAEPPKMPDESPGAEVPDDGPGEDKSDSGANPVRSFFPETWIWSTMLTDYAGKATLRSKVPDSITSWSLFSFSISKDKGLGIGPVKELSVTKPFFLSLDLPYSAISGETLPLKVVLYNYHSSSLQIQVELAESQDFELITQPVSTSVEVEPQGLKQLVYSIRPKAIGSLTLSVQGLSSLFNDAIQRVLLVEAPGIREGDLQSKIISHGDVSSSDVTFSMVVPEDAIDGSVRAFLTLTGDILGAPMSNLQSLLQMPTGCGEQNMVGFAPDVFITRYLQNTNQLKPEIQQQALMMMTTGYQTELTFVHQDGSFSAFGEQDPEGSMWLTAFVLKTFSQALPVIFIDPAVLQKASDWIISHQRADGGFEQVGQVIHTSDLMGGEKGDLAHTAFVTVALLEYDPSLDGTKKAVAFLESSLVAAQNDLYTSAIVTYALVLAKSEKAQEMITHLKNSASVSDDGSTAFWGVSKKSSTQDMTIGRPCMYCPEAPSNHDIETTAYSLLALVSSSDTSDLPLQASKWLVQQRNPSGGFLSTQDTCVGLQALTAFVEKTFSNDFQLTLTLSHSAQRDFNVVVEINPSNFDLLQSIEIPLEGELQVQVQGKGTAVLQREIKFNRPVSETDENSYVLYVEWTEIDINLAQTKACFTPQVPDQPGMVLLEIGLPTGYHTVQGNLDSIMAQNDSVKRVDVVEGRVIFYLSGLQSDQEYCLTLQCQKIFLADGIQNPVISVYSYYSPELRASRSLKVSSDNTQGNGNPTVGGGEGGEGGEGKGDKGVNKTLAASLAVSLFVVAIVGVVVGAEIIRRKKKGKRGVMLQGSFEDIPLEEKQ